MDKYDTGIWIALILIGAAGILGIFCGVRSVENQAIREGHAEYNQTSGDWQWKEKK